MSPHYRNQIADLTDWFAVRLKTMGPPRPTEQERIRGVDALPERYRKLTAEAFQVWLAERNYELSYNQLCIAFFMAAEDVQAVPVAE
jgi:hypothetical protein